MNNKKNVFLIGMLICILLMVSTLMVSCASEPEPEPESPPVAQTQPEPQAQEEVKTEGEAEEATPAQEPAQTGHSQAELDDLYAKLQDQVAKFRNDAVAAEGDKIFPELFGKADAQGQNAIDSYHNGDYDGLLANALLAEKMYMALSEGAAAYKARAEILNNQFDKLSQDEFNQAEADANTAIAAFNSGDIETALAGAKDLNKRYNDGLVRAWRYSADQMRLAAKQERDAALAIKANVAVKKDFAAADAVWDAGESAYKSQKYAAAVDAYKKVAPLFSDATQAAAIKRKNAQAAIDDANKKIKASETVIADNPDAKDISDEMAEQTISTNQNVEEEK
ncbi:MAG: hypothetical protein LBM77_10165 [Spirochaetaceae bacterium]|jgi:hypothetical protein|nr:hypothetical protein [Spirochaetaceae bacterium]